jgi:LacI family transcriptional regulator
LIYLLAEAPLSPMSNSVTISQIAETAGVSTATVDRVINGRSGVNPLTVRKVKEARVALGGAPPMRGRPRSTPNYRFAFVLPAARLGFFDLVDRVIAQNAGEFRHQHVTEVTLRLPSHDFNAFAEELAKLTDYGGLAVLAPDVPAVKLAINELVAAGVHVISMFSDVAGSMRKAFLGTDNRAAGRTAALLLGRSVLHRADERCMLFSSATRYAAEIDRRIGFAQVMEERFPSVQVTRCIELPESEEEAYDYAMQCLPKHSTKDRISAVYCVGPGSFGVARALVDRGYKEQACYAVHDLLEVHRSMLVSGTVDYVLNQDVYVSVSAAIRALRGLQDGVRGALSFKNPRVEIVTQENLA